MSGLVQVSNVNAFATANFNDGTPTANGNRNFADVVAFDSNNDGIFEQAWRMNGTTWIMPNGQAPNWSLPPGSAVYYFSYGIDSVLLTAATMLFSMLPAGMFANGWLAAKLLLLVGYVGLGILAMRPTRPTRQRTGFYLAALTAYGCIYGIARSHHPLGWLAGWMG